MTNAPSPPISLPEVDLPALTMRLMTPADGPAIRKLDERAFGPGRFTRTAYRLREGIAPDYVLSCVASIGGMLIGANLMTPIAIGETAALLLGPLTVEPAFRSRGIGEALAQHSLNLAREAGHHLVLLVGDEPYYARLGFKRSPQGRLHMPGPVDPARVLYCELQAGAFDGITGSVTRAS
ncbi:MAG: N-acetyltransferase [Alphaproteobacteria bacterium]|nr:N-acetyltransferase [Alphaproteobacteria bacterium]